MMLNEPLNSTLAIDDLLIEIGCEELPPKILKTLSTSFLASIETQLREAGLNFVKSKDYCTPRRLAVIFEKLSLQQHDQQIEKKGPPVASAMKEGLPSPALIGFAKSCQVEIDELSIKKTDKGDWYVFNQQVKGKKTAELLPKIIENALNQLPIPKRMRWGNHSFSFIRPVRWALILLGRQNIKASILGVQSNSFTFGHRFHAPEAVVIDHPSEYVEVLKTKSWVIADFEERKAMIIDFVKQALAKEKNSKNLNAVIKPELLEEVTALVEWPVALIGQFEEKFLDVPQEALILTMQDNQKYFPIIDDQGKLQAKFCFISNLASEKPDEVISGNQKVIRPRFSDAEFFWNLDKKNPLESYLPKLKEVIFQAKLGSQTDKINRVQPLACEIAEQIGADIGKVKRASQLYKSDLLSNMVQEFPELQGTMGKYYAIEQNENPIVADCLEQVYWPKFSGDVLPLSKEAQALSIAERLDTIVGIFALGQIPTGSKDPFSLRRHSLAILRIIIENNYDLDLRKLIEFSCQSMPEAINAFQSIDLILDYILERMRAYTVDLGISIDIFEAISSLKLSCPADIMKRLWALHSFKNQAQAKLLVQSNKRIDTILKRNLEAISKEPLVNPKHLVLEQEQILFNTFLSIYEPIHSMFEQQDYTGIFNKLLELAQPLEEFFSAVMVMCEEEELRNNRLNLLNLIHNEFIRVADISLLQIN